MAGTLPVSQSARHNVTPTVRLSGEVWKDPETRFPCPCTFDICVWLQVKYDKA